MDRLSDEPEPAEGSNFSGATSDLLSRNPMNLTNRLASRFKAEFVGQIVAVAAGGALTILLARLLGPDEYGLLFLAIAVFGAAGVVSKLGIAKSGARYIAEYKEQDPEQIPHILKTCFIYNIITITIVGITFLMAHQHIARLLNEPSLSPFLLFGILFLTFDGMKTYARLSLQGFEEIHFSAAIHAIDQIIRLIFALGFVLLGFGALGALVGYILGFGIASIVGLGVIYLRHYRVHATTSSIEQGLRRRIGEYMVPLTATSTANILDKRIDTVLVGFFLNPAAVSYYVVSKQIIDFVETPVSALGFTLSPSFGAQKADGNIERASRIYEEALIHSLLLYIPIAAGIILVAEPSIELIFGNEYLGAVPVLRVLGIYAILQSITRITSNGLDYLGRARERAIVKGITAVMNVILNVILIPLLGVVGAAIATLVTYSFYTFANVFIIHQEFNLRIGYIARHISLIATVTGVMAVSVFFAVDLIEGILSLALVIGLGVAVWSSLSVLTGILDVRKIASML